MAPKDDQPNPLLSTGKAPDTSLNVQLHPLVLLTISDYVTRHTLRQQKGPVLGAIIGQQNGRNYTLEHAFECKLASPDDVLVDQEWFAERLDQYKDVHKAPALDLVALFMLGPSDGPQEQHLPVLEQVAKLTGNDNIMLLLFHPEMVEKMEGGKLPISLYESFQEQLGEQTKMRFRELSFEVETGEAEMIGVDFVAKGGGNATAIPAAQDTTAGASSSKEKKAKGKGKSKEKDEEEANGTSASVLSPEDEELVASLTAKVNAIKMLNQRINLIRSYLKDLPSSYLTDASSTTPPPTTTNHALLRNVSSLLSRLPLLAPPNASAALDSAQPSISGLQQATSKEQQDVHLTSLLASLTRSIHEAQNLGSKFHVVQREKQSKERNFSSGRSGGGLMMGPESLVDPAGF